MAGLSASWQEAILRHAIDPMQQFAYVKGKNATDIALVIEAMDLLHSGQYDGFCLVSSDSDFASLAVRIRKNALPVYGFGKKEAVVSFRQACDVFFDVESLTISQKPTVPNNPKPTVAWTGNQLKQDTKLINALRQVIDKSLDNTGWASYTAVHQAFKKEYAHINLAHYGYSKLISLMGKIDLFELRLEGSQYFIAHKNSAKTKSKEQALQKDKTLIQAITNIINNNPKKDKGWTNLSYLASQLKQQNINTDHYGYKKFSDLITAIRLFDIQKRQNGIYIKTKNTDKPPAPPPHTPTTPTVPSVQPASDTPITLKDQISICIHTPNQADVVLWRLGTNKKVRHDGDMIFYGQTHSEDGTLRLDIDDTAHSFLCNLAHQDDDVRHIILTASHEIGSISHPTPMRITIEQSGQKVFENNLLADDVDARSALFLELFRTELGWQVIPRRQMIKNDLPKLCQALGIEVA